jgi:HEAT repeat protein
MTTEGIISFQQIIEALLDEETPFPPRYLHSLSDLEVDELALLAGIWSEIPTWRKHALMEDIGELGIKDTILSFEEFGLFTVRDPDPKVRLLSVHTLCEYDNSRLADLLIELLGSDEDAEVRAAAAIGLGRFVLYGELDRISEGRHREVEERLLQAARTGETPFERQRALEALGYSSRVEVAPIIENAYNSGDSGWVVSALYAMGHSAHERWQPMVFELEVGSARASLVELLEDADEDIRFNSIWALSQIGGEGIRDVLEELHAQTDDHTELERIVEALDHLEFWEGLGSLPLLDVSEDDESEFYSIHYEDEEGWD